RDQRLDISVGDHGARPFVLSPDRRDAVRQRYRQLRKGHAEAPPEFQFMCRVEVGEQQTDRDGFDQLLLPNAPDRGYDLVHSFRREGHYHLAAGIDSLVSSDAPPATHQRLRLAPMEIVLALAVDALDEGDIFEAARGNE